MMHHKIMELTVLASVFLSASACVQAEPVASLSECVAAKEEIRHYEKVFSEGKPQKDIFILGTLRGVMDQTNYIRDFCDKSEVAGSFPESLMVQEINQENGIYRNFILVGSRAKNRWFLINRFGAKKAINSEVLIREQLTKLMEAFSGQNTSKQIYVYDYVLDDSIYYLTYANADGIARKALYGAFEVDMKSLAEPWRNIVSLLSDLNEFEQDASYN